MLTDKIEAEDFPKMDREYQDLLTRLLTIQADCEIGGPQIYVYGTPWLLRAPTWEDQMRVALTAMEEIDHFRKMWKLLHDIGVDVTYLLEKRQEERFLETFRQPMPTWTDYAVFGMLIDRVGFYQLDEFSYSSFLPVVRVLPKIIAEERGHINFGVEKTRELCQTPEGKQRVQECVNKWYPRALDMFGNSNSARNQRYLEWGIKRRTHEQARAEYMAEANAVIESLGLTLPDPLANRKYR